MDLREKIQRIAGTFGIDLVQKITCTVVAGSYFASDRSVMVKSMNNSIGTIKAFLMADTDDGILIIPSDDSTVKVLYSRLNAATVIQYSAIDSIYYITGNTICKIYGSGIELNGVSYDGIMKIAPSITAWNNLQKDINKLKEAFAAWTPVSNDGGAALKAQLSALYPAAEIPVTQQSDIENTTVKHGNGS